MVPLGASPVAPPDALPPIAIVRAAASLIIATVMVHAGHFGAVHGVAGLGHLGAQVVRRLADLAHVAAVVVHGLGGLVQRLSGAAQDLGVAAQGLGGAALGLDHVLLPGGELHVVRRAHA